jgi:hypothetical protein
MFVDGAMKGSAGEAELTAETGLNAAQLTTLFSTTSASPTMATATTFGDVLLYIN